MKNPFEDATNIAITLTSYDAAKLASAREKAGGKEPEDDFELMVSTMAYRFTSPQSHAYMVQISMVPSTGEAIARVLPTAPHVNSSGEDIIVEAILPKV